MVENSFFKRHGNVAIYIPNLIGGPPGAPVTVPMSKRIIKYLFSVMLAEAVPVPLLLC